MARTAAVALLALALACVVAAASADRHLLNSNKPCSGAPTTANGVVLAAPCNTLVSGSSSPAGTTCSFTCVSPATGAGGVYTCRDKRWRVTSGAACVVPSISVEVEGSRKFGRTLELETRVTPAVNGTPVGAAILTVNGLAKLAALSLERNTFTGTLPPQLLGLTFTNSKGKAQIDVPLTTANGFAAGSTYGIGVAAGFGLDENNPKTLVTVTVKP